MKLVVTAMGREMSSDVDPRFGRAKYFIAVDTETNESTAYDNAQNLNAAQGAGIQAAETIARLDATAVVTGHVGPKAFRTLNAAGIKIYLCERMSVEQAIRSFKQGELKELPVADVESHWA